MCISYDIPKIEIWEKKKTFSEKESEKEEEPPAERRLQVLLGRTAEACELNSRGSRSTGRE
jgi:hypothetical protein